MSGLVPATELTALQTLVTSSLDLTCVIQRKTPTRTAEGYQIDGYATIATTVCNLAEPPTLMMQQYASRIAAEVTWQVRLPYNTDVQADDQLIVSGSTLRVEVVLNPESYNTSIRVLASAQKGGAL